MATRKPPRQAAALALILLLLTLFGWWAWQQVSRPWGSQAVNFTPAQQQCAQEGRLRYCVYRAAGGVNGDVVYHLHGRKLEPEIWNDPTYFTAQVQAEWQRAGLVPPTVVALSYGPVWLLAPPGQAGQSGLLGTVWQDISAIEARMGAPRRRLLVGESMGGLNSLVLGLSQPQHFHKVAALCPNVYVDSPFAPWPQIREAIVRTGADPRTTFGIWQLARDYVADEAEWRRLSPLTLIETAALQTARPSLYLSAGLYDRYGLYEGVERLAQRAAQRGLPTEWHPLYGGHCAIDVASLAAFLVR
ncbi:esterase [beta proteobacterium AAP121]|nr:esterase [beta proteobacterium AAP65]KPG00130.1 esterase [beta proteobacterium AAP121]